jgi:hypothetical protein
VFQLRVTLEGADPPIWRRLLVPGSVGLDSLHDVFQVAMGWTDSHLHSFTFAKQRYGMNFEDHPADELDEKAHTLLEAVGNKRQFRYEYDFGDDWQHQVVIEEKLAIPLGLTSPVCLDGQRACPPEDCGGTWGYANMLEAISDPKHEEHDESIEWLGDDFDPEEFSVATTNAVLQRLR